MAEESSLMPLVGEVLREFLHEHLHWSLGAELASIFQLASENLGGEPMTNCSKLHCIGPHGEPTLTFH